MALVTQCDRCGHQEEDKVANRRLPTDWLHILDQDLCPNCVRELREWLKLMTKALHP